MPKGHYNHDQKPPFVKQRVKSMFKHVLNFNALFRNNFPHKRFNFFINSIYRIRNSRLTLWPKLKEKKQKRSP